MLSAADKKIRAEAVLEMLAVDTYWENLPTSLCTVNLRGLEGIIAADEKVPDQIGEFFGESCEKTRGETTV